MFFIIAVSVASGTAHGLTWLALIAVPILAAFALGWAIRGTRWWLSLLVAPLFALAYAHHHTIWGQGAATPADRVVVHHPRRAAGHRDPDVLAEGRDQS